MTEEILVEFKEFCRYSSEQKYYYLKYFLTKDFFINSGTYNNVYKIYFLQNRCKIIFALRESKKGSIVNKQDEIDRFEEYKTSKKMEELEVGVKIHNWFWIDVSQEKKFYQIMDYFEFDFLSFLYYLNNTYKSNESKKTNQQFLWDETTKLLKITIENNYFLLDCKPANILIHKNLVRFVDFDTEWVVSLVKTRFDDETNKKCYLFIQLYFIYLFTTLSFPSSQIFVDNLFDMSLELNIEALRDILFSIMYNHLDFYEEYFSEYSIYSKLLEEQKLYERIETYTYFVSEIIFNMFFRVGQVQRRLKSSS